MHIHFIVHNGSSENVLLMLRYKIIIIHNVSILRTVTSWRAKETRYTESVHLIFAKLRMMPAQVIFALTVAFAHVWKSTYVITYVCNLL